MQRYTVYAKDRSVYRYLHFNGLQIEKLLSELCIPTEQPIKHIKESLVELFQKLAVDAESNTTLSRLRAEYHILYLLSKLSKPSEEEKAFGILNGVIDSMEHSFSAPYNAKNYADMLYISVSRFNHFFKESVGVSPHRYYMNIRIKNAQELLEQTDLHINVIAQNCGYEDAQYFAQAFKKQVGTTPSEYRKIKNNS
jgi:transcriptional regulator GlxA family with amidase domain